MPGANAPLPTRRFLRKLLSMKIPALRPLARRACAAAIPLSAAALLLALPQPAGAHDPAEEMALAASVWLAALDEEAREKATHPFGGEAREDWHFVPKPFEGEGVRAGVPLKEMEGEQRHLAYALVQSGLSHRGYLTAMQIMSLEQVLWELEQSPRRDTLMYYLAIFGEPGADRWGWRFEGHHLSLSFTIVDGVVVSGTPNFFASNPAEVRQGPRKGLRVLAAEEDAARALVGSLDETQREAAVLSDVAPNDILTGADPQVEAFEETGIGWADLSREQRGMLRELLRVYVHRLRGEMAGAEMAAIREAGFDQITFAWAGGTEPGEGHYYRVQGPTFLLEYANTQNDANHVHASWRRFDGDFGRDVLREHYQAYRHD